MFHLNFPGTYQRYKSGTAKAINWLYATAIRCGYQPINADVPQPKVKAKKGGKKGRKQNSAHKGLQQSEHNIDPWEIPVIAEVVAQSNPTTQIPTWLPVILEQVVSGRKEAADWYTLHPNGPSAREDDRKHRHFILILEQTVQILRPLFPSKPKATGAEDVIEDQETRFDEMVNQFDVLEVEEPGEGSYPVPDTTSKKCSPKTKFENEGTDEEKAFAIFCFFKDFTTIRDHVKLVWQQFEELGEIDVAAAALITNTAFEYFQRLETSLVAALPDDLKEAEFGQLKHLLEGFMLSIRDDASKCSCHYYNSTLRIPHLPSIKTTRETSLLNESDIKYLFSG